MTPLGAKGCETPVVHTRVRDVRIEADNVEAFSALLRQGSTLRLVVCADVRSFEDPPAHAAWGNVGPARRTFAPLGRAPALPLVVDAVTGQTLAAHVKGCYDPALADPRERD